MSASLISRGLAGPVGAGRGGARLGKAITRLTGGFNSEIDNPSH